jgi:hypothetical protein
MKELTLYEFHKKIYRHYFCSICGTQVIIRTIKDDHPIVEINVRTVDDIDVEKLKMDYYNGKEL